MKFATQGSCYMAIVTGNGKDRKAPSSGLTVFQVRDHHTTHFLYVNREIEGIIFCQDIFLSEEVPLSIHHPNLYGVTGPCELTCNM